MLLIVTIGLLAVWTVAGRIPSPTFYHINFLKNFVEIVQFTFQNLLLQRRRWFSLFYRTDTLPYSKHNVTRLIYYLGYFQFK